MQLQAEAETRDGKKEQADQCIPLGPIPAHPSPPHARAPQRAGQGRGLARQCEAGLQDCSSKEWEEQSLWKPAAEDREWDQVGDRRQVTFTPLGT